MPLKLHIFSFYFGRERQRHLLCPASHPKFITQKGCNVLIRLTPSIRESIDLGSEAFKELFKKRTSVKRVFSRLLSIAMQDTSVIGIEGTQNYCTISHITLLLVALAAKRSGHVDKICFVRSFVSNLLF
jgi:mRNA-degrading endonuclease HigB of HigAB toxin-antitoxin module